MAAAVAGRVRSLIKNHAMFAQRPHKPYDPRPMYRRLRKLMPMFKDRKPLPVYGYRHVLQQCGKLDMVREARIVHAHIVLNKLTRHAEIGPFVVSCFGKLRLLADAQRSFRVIYRKSLRAWCAIIMACVHSGEYRLAFDYFQAMRLYSHVPDDRVFVAVLAACSGSRDLYQGKLAHQGITRLGLERGKMCTALITMYGRCGSLADAVGVFDHTEECDRELGTWNALMEAYVVTGRRDEAVVVLCRLQLEGLRANGFSFAILLQSCKCEEDVEFGRKIHDDVMRRKLQSKRVVGSALVEMYTRCGLFDDADELLRGDHRLNIDAWNCMIQAYLRRDRMKEALLLSMKMEKSAVRPNKETFLFALQACSSIEDCKQLHRAVFDSERVEIDEKIQLALVDAYSKYLDPGRFRRKNAMKLFYAVNQELRIEQLEIERREKNEWCENGNIRLPNMRNIPVP